MKLYDWKNREVKMIDFYDEGFKNILGFIALIIACLAICWLPIGIYTVAVIIGFFWCLSKVDKEFEV